jgi:hypothetical protein
MQLVRVLPAWHGLKGNVHLVFTTRRGLPSAVRALIDHLAAGFPREELGKRALLPTSSVRGTSALFLAGLVQLPTFMAAIRSPAPDDC